MPTLDICYFIVQFSKLYRLCVRVTSGGLLLAAHMATFLEVRKSLFLIVYSWFFLLRSSRTQDTIHFLLFFVFFCLVCKRLSLKAKVINQTIYIWATKTSFYQMCNFRKKDLPLTEKKCFFLNIKYNTLSNFTDLSRLLQACSLCLKNNFLCCIGVTDTTSSSEGISRSISYQWQDSSFMLNLPSFY